MASRCAAPSRRVTAITRACFVASLANIDILAALRSLHSSRYGVTRSAWDLFRGSLVPRAADVDLLLLVLELFVRHVLDLDFAGFA